MAGLSPALKTNAATETGRVIQSVPPRGLGPENFRRVARGGFGDGYNSYAHSMIWYEGHLYVGTTRSNLCSLKIQSAYRQLPLNVWPVDCPDTRDELYKLDLRSQIWRYDPTTEQWEMVLRAPRVEGIDGSRVPREIGYRSMVVFQGPGDPAPALYVSAWGPSRSRGGHILRSRDGRNFRRVTKYGILDTRISATRSLTAFKGRIFFSPTAIPGKDGSQVNTAGVPLVIELPDPGREDWFAANEPGFGDPGNRGVFSLMALGDQLYAGTFNLEGFQVWASPCEGRPPYKWRKVLTAGAWRGAFNQAVAAMYAFKGSLYLGSGVQGGGYDRVNGIGPAAAELIRVNADDSWDLIIGDARETPDGAKEPLSGLRAGFGSLFNGYMWSLGSYDGWLYAGSYDWSVMLRWANLEAAPPQVQRVVALVGAENIVTRQSGFEFWRSFDGENWLPITRQGFGNPYNWGLRNLVPTPYGLFAGTANVFGPRVAVKKNGGWDYAANPDGGLEVWLGRRDWTRDDPKGAASSPETATQGAAG